VPTERDATHVELSAVSKRFAGVRALDAVSLTIARGQVQ
jgi:ABC-type sugar transport system ATPase subunit